MNDCRLDCDISRLEGCRRWVGVRGGEDMVARIILESKDWVEIAGASELGKL